MRIQLSRKNLQVKNQLEYFFSIFQYKIFPNKISESTALLSTHPEDSIQQNMNKADMIFFFILCSLNPALSMLRGTKSFKSIIHCKQCTKEDTTIVLIYLLLIVILTFINKRRLSERSKNISTSNKQIKFHQKNVNMMILSMFFIGFMGGFLSAGIAIMFSLTLIFLGLSPFIASPTALMLSCMTSGSATLLYFLNGQVDAVSGILGSLVILIFSLGTRITLYKRMMKKGKESVLVLFIIILICISIPINVYKVLPKIIEQRNAGKNIWALGSICPKD